MAPNPFQKAERTQLFARLAIDGPTGSGKTWSALEVATVFARRDGTRIAFIDTEAGSAKLYADRFDFDVLEWVPPYDPRRLAEMILSAVNDHGYGVIVVDSMTHFWTGEGGVLDIVEEAGRRTGGGNRFAGWQVGTPAQRDMVETFMRVPAHVIVTMRSKMEYVLVENERGQKVPQRVGMAPEQRAGIEYEFTMVVDMELDHKGLVSKSRAADLADVLIQPGHMPEFGGRFADWLQAGKALADASVSAGFLDRLNGIEDPTLRREAKWEFTNRFGRPDQLREDQVGSAEELVAGFEARAFTAGQGAPSASGPEDLTDPPAEEASDAQGAAPGVSEDDGDPGPEEPPQLEVVDGQGAAGRRRRSA